jgi:predicted alpha/beta superfamily hydrolase
MPTYPLATIPDTEVRVLHSEIADQDYLISVALPFHYAEHPDRRWPVIYVLDGNLYFGLVVDMVRAMNIRVDFCNELPDAFVVGVGYPVDGSLSEMLHQVMHLRMRDFRRDREEESEEFIQQHFPVPSPALTGNAANFLGFIRQELIPLVESDYRIDPADRTLLGHSWGGDFALYSLFLEPTLFRRYVVASADCGRTDEEKYAASHTSLPARLHLVVEDMEEEGVQLQTSLVRQLEDRHYTDLGLTSQVIAHSTHCAVVPPAFAAGLVAVFS